VWRGTAFGGVKGRSQLPSYVDQYPEGVIRIDPMITHNLRLDQINEAFELMHEGKSIHSLYTSETRGFQHRPMEDPAGVSPI
jgi:S-(hydroxymethyl)glutathione dehydrogenase / alcohol dehydrogenase